MQVTICFHRPFCSSDIEPEGFTNAENASLAAVRGPSYWFNSAKQSPQTLLVHRQPATLGHRLLAVVPGCAVHADHGEPNPVRFPSRQQREHQNGLLALCPCSNRHLVATASPSGARSHRNLQDNCFRKFLSCQL